MFLKGVNLGNDSLTTINSTITTIITTTTTTNLTSASSTIATETTTISIDEHSSNRNLTLNILKSNLIYLNDQTLNALLLFCFLFSIFSKKILTFLTVKIRNYATLRSLLLHLFCFRHLFLW